ncbi:acyl-CoA N-acyltransferase [Myriangium duriaei CBS 260.36]|uniref:Acyl-CoA N-acyltransferase n=1 Tax=Myriangium duriaei CBS 260.36 TaxID=1168546 RepID=A0A9P4J2K2_9PEZI|nr:acyl-CoA N-acyltransferase [Myriangium duriaei CBS 260.36]
MPNGHDGSPASNFDATIKPYVQALTLLELDSCVRLEELTFSPQERCGRTRVRLSKPRVSFPTNTYQYEYRFNECGELCLGLFTSADTTLATANSKVPSSAVPGSAATADTAVPIYSETPERKAILLGHVIATKTTNELVRDEDIEIPANWRKEKSKPVASPTNAAADAFTLSSTNAVRLGHKEGGRTICIHSFAVLPDFQRRGLGHLLLRAYVQRMQAAGVADRIALITHEKTVPFYESLGFENQGPSPVAFGGGGWVDMVVHLHADDDLL